MGVTVGELKKLGSEGQITADILINSLAKGFELNKGNAIQPGIGWCNHQRRSLKHSVILSLTLVMQWAFTELLPVITPD